LTCGHCPIKSIKIISIIINVLPTMVGKTLIIIDIILILLMGQ